MSPKGAARFNVPIVINSIFAFKTNELQKNVGYAWLLGMLVFWRYFPIQESKMLANHISLVFRKKKVWIKYAATVAPSFSLQWKSNESTKHYRNQMLLAINLRYWQEGNNSRKRMKVRGRLMQARFIEIHQVFAK